MFLLFLPCIYIVITPQHLIRMVFRWWLLMCSMAAYSLQRPPTVNEIREVLSAPTSNWDYFDDVLPPFTNSSKLHENYLYEKKKYLTTVLGLPAKKHRKL
ncbi:unnamed protein product [Caenorhabditis auriculariae]|uniref:Uncharacterized protein n=1 Tax=Caenorhabditis auriculariae TaxID=2777116 RepID=A0A8S1HTS5_9PELO|nr:unnamed protein product [Caenorhabditis auriculariae]